MLCGAAAAATVLLICVQWRSEVSGARVQNIIWRLPHYVTVCVSDLPDEVESSLGMLEDDSKRMREMRGKQDCSTIQTIHGQW